MHINHVFKDVNEALPLLLADLSRADEVGSRAGRTKELTHIGITLTEPQHREILLDHRKPNLAAQIAETMWVLSGRDDMKFLSHYLPRAKDFSDDGVSWRAGYGKRLRAWRSPSMAVNDVPVDQLAYVVDLLRRDPGTRQAVMSIWDPAIDTQPGKDIPCNDWLHFISRLGYLDLHVALRSNDAIWGWSGINQFEWSALLEIVAGLTGMKVGSLHFSTTSFHIYEHHWAKSERIRKSAFAPGNRWREEVVKESPRFAMPDGGGKSSSLDKFDSLCEDWFRLEYDIRTGSPLVGGYIDNFPEPMLKSWLVVLDWWWNGRHSALQSLAGTRLEMATHYSVQPPSRETDKKIAMAVGYMGGRHKIDQVLEAQAAADGTLSAFVGQGPTTPAAPSDFIRKSIALHNSKHQSYGDSWKRRGEMLGIMANIARKVDRLGGADTADENSADTAMDLMIYLAKYAAWLDSTAAPADEQADHGGNRELIDVDRRLFESLSEPVPSGYVAGLHEVLRDGFEHLEHLVTNGREQEKAAQVDRLLMSAYRLAVYLDGSTSTDEYRGADVD